MNRSDKQKQEQRHQEDLRRLQSFRPIDDTFMRGLFKENLPLAQLVLRIITGKPDLTLTKCETQADLKRVTGALYQCLRYEFHAFSRADPLSERNLERSERNV